MATAIDSVKRATATTYTCKEIGREGSGLLQFSTPTDVAVCPVTGHVIVADPDNKRIQVLSSDLKQHIRDITDGLERPQYVTVNKEGDIYVSDNSARKLFIYSKDGEKLTTFKYKQDLVWNGLYHLDPVDQDQDDNEHLDDQADVEQDDLDQDDNGHLDDAADVEQDDLDQDDAADVEQDNLDPGQDEDVHDGQKRKTNKRQNIKIKETLQGLPYGIAVDKKDNVYLCRGSRRTKDGNSCAGDVMIFNIKNREDLLVSQKGSLFTFGDFRVNCGPRYITVCGGRVFVSDFDGYIHGYSTTGIPEGDGSCTYTYPRIQKSEKNGARGLTANTSNDLVCVSDNGAIFMPGWQPFVAGADGQDPRGMAISRDGRIIVANGRNNNLLVYTRSGPPLQ